MEGLDRSAVLNHLVGTTYTLLGFPDNMAPMGRRNTEVVCVCVLFALCVCLCLLPDECVRCVVGI